MEAELTIKMPDGSTQTIKLMQVSLQTTYGLEPMIPLPDGSMPSSAVTSRLSLNGIVISGGVVVSPA